MSADLPLPDVPGFNTPPRSRASRQATRTAREMADAAQAADPHAARFGAFVRSGRSLLDVLHAIQDECRYVPPEAIAPVAAALSLSRAEVHGVVTFYHYFRTSPPPATVIQLCRAEACRSMGTEQLASHMEKRTGCRFDASHAAGTKPAVLAVVATAGATGDAAAPASGATPGELGTQGNQATATAHAAPTVSLESVYCLGQCATSPALFFNDRLYAKVTPQKFDALWDARQREQVIGSSTPAATATPSASAPPPVSPPAADDGPGAAR